DRPPEHDLGPPPARRLDAVSLLHPHRRRALVLDLPRPPRPAFHRHHGLRGRLPLLPRGPEEDGLPSQPQGRLRRLPHAPPRYHPRHDVHRPLDPGPAPCRGGKNRTRPVTVLAVVLCLRGSSGSCQTTGTTSPKLFG